MTKLIVIKTVVPNDCINVRMFVIDGSTITHDFPSASKENFHDWVIKADKIGLKFNSYVSDERKSTVTTSVMVWE